MKPPPDFSPLCQSFFAQRLIAPTQSEPHTIAAYAPTFRLLAKFAQRRLETPPSKLALAQLDAPFLASFLDDLEGGRSNGAAAKCATERHPVCFIITAALEMPQHAALDPARPRNPVKRLARPLVGYLARDEVEACS